MLFQATDTYNFASYEDVSTRSDANLAFVSRTHHENKWHFRTGIISDMHLGRHAAFAEYMLETLQNATFDVLVINGDGFDGLNWRENNYDELPEMHKRCIDGLFAHVARGGKLVYIPGNHDEEVTVNRTINFKSRDKKIELPVTICERYEHIDARGDKNLILHGHQFDDWHLKPIKRKIAEIADLAYEPLLKLSQVFRKASIDYTGIDVSLIAPLKFGVKKLLGIDKKMREAVERMLDTTDYKRIFCGHTHHAELSDRYGNSGNIVEDGNFLAETASGEWKLFHIAEARKEWGLTGLVKERDVNPFAKYRSYTNQAIPMLCKSYPKQGKHIQRAPEFNEPGPEYAFA